MKRKTRRYHTKGETLVETIISFALVLLILTTVTAIVQVGIRLNGRAAERAAALELACAAVEDGEEKDAPLGGELLLTLPDKSQLSMPIRIYTTDMLIWFEGGG
jgi:hypothetical protein